VRNYFTLKLLRVPNNPKPYKTWKKLKSRGIVTYGKKLSLGITLNAKGELAIPTDQRVT
jgi:hypothetical protein